MKRIFVFAAFVSALSLPAHSEIITRPSPTESNEQTRDRLDFKVTLPKQEFAFGEEIPVLIEFINPTSQDIFVSDPSPLFTEGRLILRRGNIELKPQVHFLMPGPTVLKIAPKSSLKQEFLLIAWRHPCLLEEGQYTLEVNYGRKKIMAAFRISTPSTDDLQKYDFMRRMSASNGDSDVIRIGREFMAKFGLSGDPLSLGIITLYVDALQRSNQEGEGFTLFERALAISSDNADKRKARRNLAEMYYSHGMLDQAINSIAGIDTDQKERWERERQHKSRVGLPSVVVWFNEPAARRSATREAAIVQNIEAAGFDVTVTNSYSEYENAIQKNPGHTIILGTNTRPIRSLPPSGLIGPIEFNYDLGATYISGYLLEQLRKSEN